MTVEVLTAIHHVLGSQLSVGFGQMAPAGQNAMLCALSVSGPHRRRCPHRPILFVLVVLVSLGPVPVVQFSWSEPFIRLAVILSLAVLAAVLGVVCALIPDLRDGVRRGGGCLKRGGAGDGGG